MHASLLGVCRASNRSRASVTVSSGGRLLECLHFLADRFCDAAQEGLVVQLLITLLGIDGMQEVAGGDFALGATTLLPAFLLEGFNIGMDHELFPL